MPHLRSLFAGLFIVFACLAGGCSDRSEPPAPPAGNAKPAAAEIPEDPDAPAARPRIVAFGDSLTAGLGLLEQQAYPAILQRKIDADGYQFDVVNAGVSGDTSAGGLR